MDNEERSYGLMTDIQKAQSFDKVQELILAYADEIRAEAAEKAIRHIHDLGTVYTGDSHYIAVDPYHFEDALIMAITGKDTL